MFCHSLAWFWDCTDDFHFFTASMRCNCGKDHFNFLHTVYDLHCELYFVLLEFHILCWSSCNIPDLFIKFGCLWLKFETVRTEVNIKLNATYKWVVYEIFPCRWKNRCPQVVCKHYITDNIGQCGMELEETRDKKARCGFLQRPAWENKEMLFMMHWESLFEYHIIERKI